MEETGQTVQETPKVQAEQTGENGKNVDDGEECAEWERRGDGGV